MRVRVTMEYDYEDPEAWGEDTEADFWRKGEIDCPTLEDGEGVNLTVKAEKISD